MNKHILVVEDEQSIADTICYALTTEHFTVQWYSLGSQALEYIRQNPVDLVILDVGLPDMNGFDVCKTIRTFSQIPVMFLTARKEEIDRVVGFEIGADDYVAKPFSPRELVARVKAILKRAHTVIPVPQTIFEVDQDKARINYQGKPLDLTRYEYRMLRLLLSQPGRIFSREQIMEQVWEAPEASVDRTVDAHIKTLRAKLRNADVQEGSIKTHRGMGYSIELMP